MTPLALGDRLVARAISQIGVVEERGNRGVPYERYALTGEDPLPWCARFVRWVYTQEGERLPGNRYLIGRVATLQEELAQRGGILTRDQRVEPGDLIFLRDRGASDQGPGHHVGIVQRVGPLTVTSIDGNIGDGVQRVERLRSLASIWCYARWPARAVG